MSYQKQISDIIDLLALQGCVGQALNEKAEYHRRKGNWTAAMDFARRSLDLCQSKHDLRCLQSAGIAQMHLGAIYHAMGDLAEAVRLYQASVTYFAYDRRRRGIAFWAVGLVRRELGEWGSALEALQSAFDLLEGLDVALCDKVQAEIEHVVDLYDSASTGMRPEAEPTPAEPPTTSTSTESPPRPAKTIPVVARIAAGQPILADANIEGYITIDETLARLADFALRVQGDSMIEAGILPGDLVLMQEQNAPPSNGQIVAAIVEPMNVEATLKRFYAESDHVRLMPANDKYALILIRPDGVSEASLRDLYHRRYPSRKVEIYSGHGFQISGWAVALIREQVG
ncbi:MAG TPA: tetratricopeptide repeat protein [Anaerolineae bacterium]|nr:tetratricopeptide repeat protein [Anaerolineae bacterium]